MNKVAFQIYTFGIDFILCEHIGNFYSNWLKVEICHFINTFSSCKLGETDNYLQKLVSIAIHFFRSFYSYLQKAYMFDLCSHKEANCPRHVNLEYPLFFRWDSWFYLDFYCDFRYVSMIMLYLGLFIRSLAYLLMEMKFNEILKGDMFLYMIEIDIVSYMVGGPIELASVSKKEYMAWNRKERPLNDYGVDVVPGTHF